MERRVLVAISLSFAVLFLYQALFLPPPPPQNVTAPAPVESPRPPADAYNENTNPPFPDGDIGILLIHGFTGSPWDLRPLGEALLARGFHVKAPLLPGHGTRWQDCNDSTHDRWSATVTETRRLEEFVATVEAIALHGTWRSQQGFQLETLTQEVVTLGELQGLTEDPDGKVAERRDVALHPLQGRDLIHVGVVGLQFLGTLAGDGGEVVVDRSYVTTASVVFDAVFVPGGRHVDALRTHGDALHFLSESFKHGKPVGATGVAVELLRLALDDMAAVKTRKAPAKKG